MAPWPGRVPAGRVCGTPVMNLDILPTAFALAGVGLPDDRIVDGRNILDVLRGNDARGPHEAIYFYHYDLLEGIRMGNWKYIEKMNRYTWPIAMDAAPVPDGMGKKQMGNRWPLLYDLSVDPGESYNVINTRPDVAQRLRAAMKAWERAEKKDPRGFRS